MRTTTDAQKQATIAAREHRTKLAAELIWMMLARHENGLREVQIHRRYKLSDAQYRRAMKLLRDEKRIYTVMAGKEVRYTAVTR